MKYGRYFAVEFLFDKLRTLQICMGLSQTTSVNLANYYSRGPQVIEFKFSLFNLKKLNI